MNKSFIIDILGPKYNYSDKIADPNQLKVSSNKVDSLWDDVGALTSYVDTITFGEKQLSKPFGNTPNQKPLGNKFFIKNGTCDNTSVDECKGKDRFIYINNVPSGKIPCLEQTGIKLPETNFRGLVPGILENVMAINPVSIFNSLAGKGNISKKCYKSKKYIGYEGNYKTQTKCSPKGVPIECLPKIFEKFENQNESKMNIYILICVIIIIIIILIIKISTIK